ncbi:MAG: MFS transporter [Euryarchaeota archaeon]|nr:MFS transporter [Euryarchaeota archaeon]
MLTFSSQKNDQRWFHAFLPNKAANGIIEPILPVYAVNLGASLTQVGLLASLFSLASTPATYFWGKISDLLHKRMLFIALGFLFTSISTLLLALAVNVQQLILIRAAQGFLVAASVPAVGALIADTVAPAELGEKIGIFNKICGIGWVLGLVIGAISIGKLSIESLFILSAIMSLIASYFILKWGRDPTFFAKKRAAVIMPRPSLFEKRQYHPHMLFHVPKLTMVEKELFLYLAGTFLIFVAGTAVFTPFPVFLSSQLKLSNQQIFLVYTINAVASALSYEWVGKAADRVGHRKVQISGFLSRGIFLLFFVWAQSVWEVTFLFALIGVTWAIITVSGSAVVIKLAPLDKEGEIIGVYNAVIGISTIFGGLIGGLISQFYGFKVLFLFGAATVAIGALVVYVAFKMINRSSEI